ncbi:hypothetical protein PFBG_03928 [Plasmodium falciparum 7G8]|uniref:Uncharacterized protein n=1 Tax=Plasmodium falciparum (isolate 7G8) TaxID=57266 RepID=W7FIY0_PLAF8|nr:hypothetical protein PFBG_03928 [Plasmodium falciparum 7G8]
MNVINYYIDFYCIVIVNKLKYFFNFLKRYIKLIIYHITILHIMCMCQTILFVILNIQLVLIIFKLYNLYNNIFFLLQPCNYLYISSFISD